MPADRGSSVLTIDELAEYLKVSKSTLYKLAQEGSIPGQKVGKHFEASSWRLAMIFSAWPKKPQPN